MVGVGVGGRSDRLIPFGMLHCSLFFLCREGKAVLLLMRAGGRVG